MYKLDLKQKERVSSQLPTNQTLQCLKDASSVELIDGEHNVII